MALFYISSGNVFQKLNWSKLNSDLRHVCDWMKLNQLTLCLALRAKCRVHLALLIKRLLCTLIILLMFQNRFEFHLFTAISRKVFGKNVHATIPKGNMGYDQYIVPDDCNCNLFVVLSFSTRKHMSMASSAILSNFFEEKWKHKPTHNAFWDCRVHFFRQPFSKAVYML